MVTIGTGGEGQDHPVDLLFHGGMQDVYRASYVYPVGGHRVFDRSWDRAQGGLVAHLVDTFHGFQAGVVIADVAFEELKIGVGFERFDVFEVTVGEVVEDTDGFYPWII